GLADLRNLDLKLPLGGLHRPRPEPVAQPALLDALRTLIMRPALIAGAPQPRVELVLHSPLDDQPGTQLRQLRQRLARALPDPDRQHLLDPGFNLRRRRYGTSHGVGLLHRLAGLEGTYAVVLTAAALFTALLRRDPLAACSCRIRATNRSSSTARRDRSPVLR